MNSFQTFWDWYKNLFSDSDNKVRLAAWATTIATITFLLTFLFKPVHKWFLGLFKKPILNSTIINSSSGGKGGNASVIGNKGIAIGGKGGNSGPGGKGGDGGSAEVMGDNGFAMGGDGGEAGQASRGGNGGKSPLSKLKEKSLSDPYLDFVLLYSDLQIEYSNAFNCEPPNQLPEEWVNMRLIEINSEWSIKNTESGYTLHRRVG